MPEPTKIDFHHMRISQISDYTELVEMLFPGNRNQRHAAACIVFELKWVDHMVPNLAYIETKYGVTRRILQRARAKLSRLGLIEHVSYLNIRYGGQHGWKLSSKFETALRQTANKSSVLREKTAGVQNKDDMLLQLVDARRNDMWHCICVFRRRGSPEITSFLTIPSESQTLLRIEIRTFWNRDFKQT